MALEGNAQYTLSMREMYSIETGYAKPVLQRECSNNNC
jgi:hypothetical protein